MSEGALQPWLGVEQSSMSKYLDLAAGQAAVSPKFLTGLLEAGTYALYKKRKKLANKHISP